MALLPRAALPTLGLVLTGCGAGSHARSAKAPANAAPAERAGSPAWGGAVPAPQDEQSVRALLRAAALGDPEQARTSCARFVVAMPALWQGLVSIDPMLERVGLVRAAGIETPRGRRHVPIRIFAGQDALLRLLGSPAFADLARRVAGGSIRPASPLERKLVYDLVGGFEPDTQVTVAQAVELRVAFLLEQRRVFWMELLSAWQPSQWALSNTAGGGPARVPRFDGVRL